MGRYGTGAITARGAIRLNLKELKRKGVINPNSGSCSGTIDWDSGAKIGFSVENGNDVINLRIYYVHTDYKGNKTSMSYTVGLVALTSNLGKGKIYFFRCPISNKLCRTLYMAYGSKYFKHRAAYNSRIYYMTQIRSKNDRFNYRYWDLDEQLEHIYSKGYKSQYKGKTTKIAMRVIKLEWLKNRYDQERFSVLATKWGIDL